MLFHHKDLNLLHIPKGIRLISWATAIRFAGWGFVEIFIPIFLLSFVHNYAEVGVLRSVYDVVFLLALPVVSRLADRVPSKKIILSGLALYPLIALCYFYSGVFGAISLLIVARFINGISYALDSVGKRTYMRRNAHGRIGIIFGYFDTLANFWWLAAAVVGLFLINTFPLHKLFLFIVPTTLVAMFLVWLLPRERKTRVEHEERFKISRLFKEVYVDYKQLFSFIKHWNLEQKYTAVLYGFVSTIFILIAFFLPLISFTENKSYTAVFLLSAFAVLPFIFGVPIGFLSDKAGPKGVRRVIFASVCLLLFLPFTSSLFVQLVLVFLISVCAYYAMLALERSATIHETQAHMGSLSGAFLSVAQLSQIISPILIGFFIDEISLIFTISILSIIGLLLIVPLYIFDIKIFKKS